MKEKIIIKGIDNQIIYKGNILDIPIKEEYIVKKSIEIFNDDDPCIIHQSIIVKRIVDELLTLIGDKKELYFNNYLDKLNYINIKNLEQCVLIIEGD